MKQAFRLLPALFALALSSSAAGPKTMVALYKIQFGRMNECIAALNTAVTPVLDRLMSEGAIDSYGIDIDVLHVPNMPNLAAWFSGPTYAGMQKANDAVLAALASHPQQAKLLLDSADMNAHADMLLETEDSKFGSVPAGAMPFRLLVQQRVKPGKLEEYMRFGAKQFAPVYEQLVKDGVIHGYEVLAPALHTEEPGTLWILMTMPDMAAMDKLDAALEAKMKSLSAAERSIVENTRRQLTEEAGHRDFLMRSVVYKRK